MNANAVATAAAFIIKIKTQQFHTGEDLEDRRDDSSSSSGRGGGVKKFLFVIVQPRLPIIIIIVFPGSVNSTHSSSTHQHPSFT